MSNKANHKVYLLTGVSPSMPLTWLKVDHNGQLVAQGQASGFDDYINQTIKPNVPLDDKMIILLPGDCVALRILPSPPKGRAQFNAAAHYLLEDDLAENIENLHIATAMRVSQNASQGLCLAISKSIMQAWHDCFIDYDIFPDVMTADFMALPVNDDHQMVVFRIDNRLMVNSHQGGIGVDEEISEMLMPDIIEKWAPENITYYTDENYKIPLATEAIAITHNKSNREIDFVKLIAQGPIGEALGNSSLIVPNLLSRDYTRKVNWRLRLGPLRGAMIAASICGVLLSSLWVFDGIRASREARAFESLALEIHNQSFPEARGQDPAQYARKLLGAKRGQDDFLTLWLRFAQVINNEEGVEIDTISYAADNQSMRLSIRVDGRPNLDGFLNALRSNNINAEEGRMSNSNGQLTGDLVVRL